MLSAQPCDSIPGLSRVEALSTTPIFARLVDRMPQPGDRHPGFITEPGVCWILVHSKLKQLQATHCREEPTFTGRWYSPRDDVNTRQRLAKETID